MKEFHAKKWLNEEFKRHDMWIESRDDECLLLHESGNSTFRLVKFSFEDDCDEWVATVQTRLFNFRYDQLRLICSTVDELNRQHDMEMDV